MAIDFKRGRIADVLEVDAQIPEFDGRTTLLKLKTRIADNKHLILIALSDGKPIAYKLGYELSSSEFYSWLGGVIPEYRKRGIASELRLKQELWAVQQGYQKISVKSMNQYPAMLQLLIASQYLISGYEDSGTPETSKIKFSKKLIG